MTLQMLTTSWQLLKGLISLQNHGDIMGDDVTVNSRPDLRSRCPALHQWHDEKVCVQTRGNHKEADR